ncbi:META domain-containing protein [Seongchinamella sediminis]|uniref:META domain-containing protein n=1 Tax=Seongchinamella sediminis TaxID=2283635 RepID=A0A3L7E3E4_9GAMM|nr:YbaY family lipoprotein [Seongchinamella sediminis]RLQ23435.1 META domain-containing protein [Seongchinamella sediminis]
MQINTVSLRTLLLIPVVAALAACGGSGEEPAAKEEVATMSTIEGTVFYRERMLLPPGAEVEVQLQDVSRADALATVMASVMFTPEGGPPYPFAIEYDPAGIDERMRYSLRATISAGDKLMFSSTEFIDPFSGEDIRIMVQRVPEPVDRTPPAVAPEVATGDSDSQLWLLATLGGEPAPVGAEGRAIDLVLDADTGTASGFSGCNRYTGSFSNEGKSAHGTPLSFGPLAGTMMACAEGGEVERAYLQMLAGVDGYRMQGSSLELLRGDEVVATFTMR